MVTLLPLIIYKIECIVPGSLSDSGKDSWLLTVGISYYSLQMVAYLVDVYKAKIEPQKNIFKYILFIIFFPQVIQGPIPRFGQLGKQLYEGNTFNEKNIVKGIHLIIWGYFLKFMIADKASVVVNTIFNNYQSYMGGYVWVAGVLYSIQLYTDFLSCVSIAQGVAALFGIDIIDNFKHPYFATSIQDFWRRWHISLSLWFRDYVYIPLGGNRKGNLLKYVNLTITFFISGIWHGASFKFLLWGGLHAFYQVAGALTYKLKRRLYDWGEMPEGSLPWRIMKVSGTFFWVMLGWIIFRADSWQSAFLMIKSMFTVYNPWIFFDDAIYTLGLDWKEWNILLISIGLLIFVSFVQRKICIREWILKQHIVIRWGIYLAAIIFIWVFGTYGFGFDAQDFIYGGF